MDSEEIKMYVAGLEHRIETLSNDNAALSIALNKLMMENMKLKADIKRHEQKTVIIESPRPERVVKLE